MRRAIRERLGRDPMHVVTLRPPKPHSLAHPMGKPTYTYHLVYTFVLASCVKGYPKGDMVGRQKLISWFLPCSTSKVVLTCAHDTHGPLSGHNQIGLGVTCVVKATELSTKFSNHGA